MARLPDETALGPLEAAGSGRPIAIYDTSGYARGAAAMAEGAKDLGAGILTAGKGLAAYAAQKAAAEQKLQLARGNAELTAKELTRTNAIERETDPAGMVERHVDEAAKEFEQAAQRISDPQLRTNLLLHRDGYVAGVTRAAKQQEGVLSADSDMTAAFEAADTLADGALNSTDPWAMNRAADVFHDYVDALREVGLVGDAKAADIKRNWATDLAERALLQAPAAHRSAAIEAATKPVASDAPNASADNATQSAAGQAAPQPHDDLVQLARLLPADVQARIGYEARAEVDRSTTLRTWEKAGLYEQSMANASRGDPKPAPWRAVIEADPDLDDRTRTRLLKQHDAMQLKLDRFWSAKAAYDKPDGRKFDGNDTNDREFVEQIYTWLGADNAALHGVVERTGILPDAALNDVKGRLHSKEPANVAQAIADVSRLTGSFPLLLALSGESADDLQNALSEFRYYRQSGTEDQAIKRFIEARTSNARTARSTDLTGAHVDAAIIRATPVSHFYRVFGDNPAVSRAVIFAYRNLVKERYAETGDLNLAKAQADGHMKPLLDEAAKDAARKGPADRPSWIERAWLNGLDGYYRGTVRGAGNLRELHDLARKVEATPPEAMEVLLYELYPGLKKVGWSERIQSELQLLKTAPERYRKILADLKRYDDMKGSDTVSEFGVAAAGQIAAGLLSPESYVGWSVKGASWVVRAMKAAIQQGGIAGAADLATQWNLIEAGEQRELNGWRTVGATAAGIATGAIAGRNGGAKSQHVGITPEGPPKQQAPSPEVKLEESASVAPRPDVVPEAGPSPGPKSDVPGAPTSEVRAVAPQEMPATSQVPGEIDLGPSGPPKQQAPTAEGAPKQEQPLGVRGEEPAAPAPEIPPSKETPPTQDHTSENNASKVSPQGTASRQIIDLTKHEDGGLHHPLSKHSGMPFDFLDNRLTAEPHITGASTFHNHDEANISVQLLLDHYADQVKKLIAHPKKGKTRMFEANLSDMGSNHPSVGLVLERGASTLKPGNGVRMWIRQDKGMPEGFRVITAFPILSK